MKANIYTIKDEYLGIPLLIEGELVDWEDDREPSIIINDISHDEKPLSLWCLSEGYIKHLENRIFQTWCSESKLYRETVK